MIKLLVRLLTAILFFGFIAETKIIEKTHTLYHEHRHVYHRRLPPL